MSGNPVHWVAENADATIDLHQARYRVHVNGTMWCTTWTLSAAKLIASAVWRETHRTGAVDIDIVWRT